VDPSQCVQLLNVWAEATPSATIVRARAILSLLIVVSSFQFPNKSGSWAIITQFSASVNQEIPLVFRIKFRRHSSHTNIDIDALIRSASRTKSESIGNRPRLWRVITRPKM
jgi:hypothetical protein